MKIDHRVLFKVNPKRDDLLKIFEKAKIAIHTMKYEHFGIAIVELMSAGIITIAHNSGIPNFMKCYSWT